MKSPVKLSLLVIFAVFLASCQSNVPVQTAVPAQDVTTQQPQSQGELFTFAQAGIAENYDNLKDLAYIKAVTEKADGTFITIDPVTFIDCRGLENNNKPVPKACSPKENEGASSYAIVDSQTLVELKLAPNAGPYFLAAITGEADSANTWRTMNVPAIQALLAGTRNVGSSDYYDTDLHDNPNLFYVIRSGDTAQKVYEKYRE